MFDNDFYNDEANEAWDREDDLQDRMDNEAWEDAQLEMREHDEHDAYDGEDDIDFDYYADQGEQTGQGNPTGTLNRVSQINQTEWITQPNRLYATPAQGVCLFIGQYVLGRIGNMRSIGKGRGRERRKPLCSMTLYQSNGVPKLMAYQLML